jgi:hypothetical protein
MSTEQTKVESKKRVDPTVQHAAGGILLQGQVRNQKPGLVYRLANPLDQMMGASFMEAMGWSYVSATSGEKIAGGVATDGKLFFLGQVLMCRSREDEERDLAVKHSYTAIRDKERKATEVGEIGVRTVPVAD